MPVCVIGHKPSRELEELAVELIGALPGMVVEALVRGADLRLTPDELTIDIDQFHPAAYNKPSLEVVVHTSRGADDHVYKSRAQIREILYELVRDWMRRNGQDASVKDVDADIRFLDMCGLSFDPGTGDVHARWGGAADR